MKTRFAFFFCITSCLIKIGDEKHKMTSIRISKGFGDDYFFVGECQSQTRK